MIVLNNYDHGAIPSSLKKISSELNLSESELGGLGSLVFLGLVLGSVSASKLLYLISHRTMLALSQVILGVCLWMMTASLNYRVMCFSRLISGFSQIFITVYLPLYVDAFTYGDVKANLMPLSITGSIIGTIVGYGTTSFFINISGGTW